MANTRIKFFKVASKPTQDLVIGAVYFVVEENALYVCMADGSLVSFSGVTAKKAATGSNVVLSIPGKDNSEITIDIDALNAAIVANSKAITALQQANGQPNVIESVKVNGTALKVTNKAVDITVAEGTANGTIAVNGDDVAVHGLGSAAYTASTAYDAAGDAAKALTDAKAYVDGLTATKTGDGALVDVTVKTVGGKVDTVTVSDANVASKADVEAEATRAKAAEKANTDAIAEVKADVDAFFKDADMTASAKDTLKELQEYIAGDASAASEMLASIKANADAIDAIEADYLKAADKTALQTNINNEATARQNADNALDGRLDVVEAWQNEFTPADFTDEIATAKQEAINAAAGDATTKANKALTDAKAHTNAEIGKVVHGVTVGGASVVANNVAALGTAASKTAVTSVGTTGADSNIPTEKAVRTAINAVATVANKALTDVKVNGSSAVTGTVANITLGAAASKGVDTAVTQNGANLVTSGAVYEALCWEEFV